jgi:hypothetical protein
MAYLDRHVDCDDVCRPSLVKVAEPTVTSGIAAMASTGSPPMGYSGARVTLTRD